MRRPEGKTLAAVTAEIARRTPAAPAIFFGDQVISYGELGARMAEAWKKSKRG